MPPEEDTKEFDLEGALVQNPAHEPQKKAPPAKKAQLVIGKRQQLGDSNIIKLIAKKHQLVQKTLQQLVTKTSPKTPPRTNLSICPTRGRRVVATDRYQAVGSLTVSTNLQSSQKQLLCLFHPEIHPSHPIPFHL